MLSLRGRRHRVDEVAYSPCGRWLAAGGRNAIHVWDLTAPTARPKSATLPEYTSGHGLMFRTDGRLFFLILSTYRLFDPLTGEATAYHTGDLATVVSADGRWLVTSSSNDLLSEVRQLNPDGSPGRPGWRFETPAWAFALSPDSVRLTAVGGDPPHLTVFDVATGAVAFSRAAVMGPDTPVFAPDGSALAVWHHSGLAVYDLTDPDRPPHAFDWPMGVGLMGVAFHPSGRRLGTVGDDRVVRLWDTATWQPVAEYKWDIGKLYGLAFGPDGTTAAVGSSTGRVLVFDLDA